VDASIKYHTINLLILCLTSTPSRELHLLIACLLRRVHVGLPGDTLHLLDLAGAGCCLNVLVVLLRVLWGM
jgi:hypothetical protein